VTAFEVRSAVVAARPKLADSVKLLDSEVGKKRRPTVQFKSELGV
jgi:hypothetical protein